MENEDGVVQHREFWSLMATLTFIGRIPPMRYITTKDPLNPCLDVDNKWVRGALRNYRVEDREHNYNWLCAQFARSLEMAKVLAKGSAAERKDATYLELLTKAMGDAIVGVTNLRDTYEKDHDYVFLVSKLKVLEIQVKTDLKLLTSPSSPPPLGVPGGLGEDEEGQ